MKTVSLAQTKAARKTSAKITQSTEADPVFAAGVELQRLRDRHDYVEGMNNGDVMNSGKIYREHELAHLRDRISALQTFLSSTRATSPQGALIQIDIALIELDMAKDQATISPQVVESQLQKIMRLLYSAGGVLEKHFGIPAGVQAISDNLDPWFQYEHCLERAGLAPATVATAHKTAA